MSTKIERHNPDGLSKMRESLYSHCVRVTGATTTLYISGQVARDEQGRTVGVGDVETQMEQVVRNLRAILRAEGGDLRNLVKVTVYTTDVRHFEAITRVRQKHFTGDLPASTLVEVSKLALPELMVEVDGIAVF